MTRHRNKFQGHLKVPRDLPNMASLWHHPKLKGQTCWSDIDRCCRDPRGSQGIPHSKIKGMKKWWKNDENPGNCLKASTFIYINHGLLDFLYLFFPVYTASDSRFTALFQAKKVTSYFGSHARCTVLGQCVDTCCASPTYMLAKSDVEPRFSVGL